MNHLDLFSGIGGFALGARLAGLRFIHHLYSDVNEFCNQVYARHFPEAVPQGDICAIDGQELRRRYPGSWLVTGGWPCQGHSNAGKGRGLADPRSGLLWELLRVLGEVRPDAALLENVPAVCSSGLDRCIAGLAEIGYDAEWGIVSAASVGAPHRRQRVWIVAYPSGIRGKEFDPVAAVKRDLADNYQAHCKTDGSGTWPDWQAEATAWQLADQPIVDRIHDGIPGWLDRLRALGNAVVPQCTAVLFRCLNEAGLLQE